MCLSEKFQITAPYSEKQADPDHDWATAQSARVNVGNTLPGNGEKFNKMPVGYDATCARDRFVSGFGGNTDATGGVEPKSLEDGFKRQDMKGTDDLYSGEHIDLFYGEVVDEKGQVGFAERNNYLDRE